MSNDEYSLRVSFSDVWETADEERAYVCGWEAGAIAQEMRGEAEFERTVHAENQTVLRRLCDAEGFSVEFTPTNPPTEGWLVAQFSRRPHVKHLAVVK
jgi:hypothetical protein